MTTTTTGAVDRRCRVTARSLAERSGIIVCRSGWTVRRFWSVLAAVVVVVPLTVVVATGRGGPVSAAGGFESLPAPVRLVDTRHTTKLAAGSVHRLPVAGVSGLPSDPASVALNVTVTQPAAAGHITVYPCGTRPTASNLNYTTGQTVANAAIATVSTTGEVCFHTHAATHLIVDASGWFTHDAYTPLTQPARLVDTRPNNPTIDADDTKGVRPAGSTTQVQIHGRAGLGKPSTVVLNVTAVAPHDTGHLTVHPCGADTPTASNLNYTTGQVVPNLVVAKVGTGGQVCIRTHAATHLIVDASGALPATTFIPLHNPARLLDTRPGNTTIDNHFRSSGQQPARGSLQLPITDRADIPNNASAVVLNITAVTPTGPGHITVHPRGTNLPTTSNLNYTPGQTVANATIARLGTNGHLCLHNHAPTHLIVDITGYLTGPPPPTNGNHCPPTRPVDEGAVEAIVRLPELHRARGTDRIAVLPCGDGGDAPPIDAGALARWLDEAVSPWFAEASRGAYTAVFEPHPLGRVDPGDVRGCITSASTLTHAPFTNVVVVPENNAAGGHATPGRAVFAPPSSTGRYVMVEGELAFVDPSVFVHEIGHSIHWPHSYSGLWMSPFGGVWTYDNPIDVMSGEPKVDWDSEAVCEIPGTGLLTSCWAQHTIAFNRVAAGWVDGRQIAVHRSGRTNYALDAPGGGDTQVVALPDAANPLRVLTIEARPVIGRDRFNEKAGVALHVIDQTGEPPQGASVNRRQAQAIGEPESYDHVVAPGESVALHGVTVRVLGSAGDGYLVTVSGTYRGVTPPN